MKKAILKFTLGLAVVVAAGYTTYASQASVELAGVAMDNVEALAEEESGGDGFCTMHIRCYDKYGNPTGLYSATSYSGPGCNGVYHAHACSDCNG